MIERTRVQGGESRECGLRVYDILLKKRQGRELSKDEIDFMIAGFTAGDIPDYQMSAWLMAIFFQGMSSKEAYNMTKAMTYSGETPDFLGIGGIKVDKHSTGGVGDKTTLVLAPLVAACGVQTVKMSGRGLGHTGGTLDKLESIPGFRTNLSKEEFLECINTVGIVIMGQTDSMVPADRKIYALRDVTATADSVPLIAASICSKKLAFGADIIVFDVKVGKGAFMKSKRDALRLAELMVGIITKEGKQGAAVISDMNQPLGHAVGNSLEVMEALDVLRGKGPEDLKSLCISLGALTLLLAGKAETPEEAELTLLNALEAGAALNKFADFITAQGGDIRVVETPTAILPIAKYQKEILSTRSGYITEVDAERIGMASFILGAGRRTKDDIIDPSVGVIVHKKIGDKIEQGEPLVTLYTNKQDTFESVARLIMESYKFSEDRPDIPGLIKQVVRG